MLTWTLITKDPVLAKLAYKSGVTRLFIDWEINGKQKRQGHLDTVISQHSYEDALKIRKAVPDAELLIRLNPFYENTDNEVEQALAAGADLIMLPMFHTINEVSKLSKMVNGRAGIVPLVETVEALELVESLVQLDGVYEIFVGLNDLHHAFKMHFMFEPVANGMLDRVAKLAKHKQMRFGFGGIAKLDGGMVTGEMVLAEHTRLASDAVILSRSFYQNDSNQQHKEFITELDKLKRAEITLLQRNDKQIKSDHQKFQQAVKKVVETS